MADESTKPKTAGTGTGESGSGEPTPESSNEPEPLATSKTEPIPEAKPPAPPADNTEKLLGAANAASGPARNAWLAHLGLLAYLLITLAGVTDRDLLLNSPVELPVIKVAIPPFSFFLAAPILLLLVHLSLLVQHVMLARKYQHFSEEIGDNEKNGARDHPDRRLVHNYVFSQLMAGPKPPLPLRMLMGLMIFVTFSLLPLLVLIFFQVKFLPYHDVATTHLHRLAILLDFILLFLVRPFIAAAHLRPKGRELGVGNKSSTWAFSYRSLSIAVSLCLVLMPFSLLVATVPQGCFWPGAKLTEDCFSLDTKAAYLWRAAQPEYSDEQQRAVFAPTAWLFGFDVLQDQIPRAWWQGPFFHRNLKLSESTLVREEPSLDVIASYLRAEETEEDAFTDLARGLSLGGRDLRYADLRAARFYKADLRGVKLQGALLSNANLHGAAISEANLQKADLFDAKMQGADLRETDLGGGADLRSANLERAFLSSANLQGAEIIRANLKEADLRSANLQRAAMSGANLQGADLSSANLREADLFDAKMQGAEIIRANLQEADLRSANLQGAAISGANLQGADLSSANLQEADLFDAKMQGAAIIRANLQGADLSEADLRGAVLIAADLQGASLDGTDLRGADLTRAKIWQTTPPSVGALEHADLTEINISSLDEVARNRLRTLIDETTNEALKARLQARLRPLLSTDADEEWKASAERKFWEAISTSPKPTPDKLSDFLAELACEDSTGGRIANGVARRVLGTLTFNGNAARLAKGLTKKNCGPVGQLDDGTRTKLCKLADWLDAEKGETICAP